MAETQTEMVEGEPGLAMVVLAVQVAHMERVESKRVEPYPPVETVGSAMVGVAVLQVQEGCFSL
jgi:hypothetical protein